MSWGERRLRAARAWRHRREADAWNRGGAAAVAGEPPSPHAWMTALSEAPRLLRADVRTCLRQAWPEPWRARTLERAEAALAGRYVWLGAEHDLGLPPPWRRDPVTGYEFPARHWSTLPVTSFAGEFDLKHIWELNLHTFFPTLAKAHALTGDPRYRAGLKTLWQSWLEANPPLAGPNYLAPVEIGLRLANWGAALDLTGRPADWDAAFLPEVYRHVYYQRAAIAGNLSRFSSANNHLLGELGTLILIDRWFPGLADAGERREIEREFEEQILRQFHPDGGNREQALHYHAFSLQFALLALHVARAEGRALSERAVIRAGRAVQYLRAALGHNRTPFDYGDNDHSEVLPLVDGPAHLYTPVLSMGTALLNDGHPPPREGDERAALLWGDAFFPGERPAEAPPASWWFPDTGHAFVRRGPWSVHFNAGELGYLSIAAHGHADALSVAVRYGDIELVIDPGTYSYRGGNPWREWLVSTPAHPTVTVDRQNQAERLGPFLWGRRYRCTRTVQPLADEALTLDDAQDVELTAEHDGYRGLGVTHRRRVRVSPDEVVIEDTLSGAGRHHVRVTWPLGEIPATPTKGGLHLGAGPGVTVHTDGFPGEGRLEAGAIDRPGTPCRAPGYDVLVPGLAWILEAEAELPLTWTTRWRAAGAGQDSATLQTSSTDAPGGSIRGGDAS